MTKKIGLVRRDTTYIQLNMSPAALVKAMRHYGLTATKVIKPIAEALEATRYTEFEGELIDSKVPDHTLRLRAALIALDLLKKHTPEVPTLDDKTFKALSKDLNEIELQSLVFKKTSKENEKTRDFIESK